MTGVASLDVYVWQSGWVELCHPTNSDAWMGSDTVMEIEQ